MHRYSRMHLSPAVALSSLETTDLEEKSRLAEGIALIAVIDHRRDYLAAGYSCMHDYCTGRLHMSQDRAFRRIQVARVALRVPEVFEYLADGRLSVTAAGVLAPHLTPETAAELLAAAAFRSRDEIARLLAERSQPLLAAPIACASAALVETGTSSLAPVQVNGHGGLAASEPCSSSGAPLAAPQVTGPRRGHVRTTASGAHEVLLVLTESEHARLREVLALDAHAVPSGDPALVYARAMQHYAVHLKRRRLGVKPGAATPAPRTGRGIPKALRRLVWERDGGRCAFVGTDGHRCGSATRVQFDHVMPLARGGRTQADNLRLLCRAHNLYEAERVLGREHVQGRRELAQRERVRAKAAAEAGATRAQAEGVAPPRNVAQQARFDDVRAALRGLGASDAEARRCAALTDAMPGATLEACVRAALAELARPVMERGERRARCTA